MLTFSSGTFTNVFKHLRRNLRVDISELFKHFNDFNDDQIIGVANDLTPHYFELAQKFILSNPGTKVGSPGRFQVDKSYNQHISPLRLFVGF